MTRFVFPLVVLAVLLPLSSQQCLTPYDDIRKLSDKAHKSLLESELQFSIDLLHTVGSLQPKDNLFFSPSSVYKALLLAYFVSANQTEASLKKALHLTADQDKLDVYGAYSAENYYQKLRAAKEKGYQLSNANRLYFAKDLKLRHCMRVLFADDLFPANFKKNLKGVVKKVNNWVADQTRNVIKDFLPEDSLAKESQLVLVNAAYFKGNWKKMFKTEDTSEHKFHRADESVVRVQMMTQENEFKFLEMDTLDAEVLELPYIGEDISMFMLLPLKSSASAVQDLLTNLNRTSLRSIVDEMAATSPLQMMVTIPKFTAEQTLELTPILESMGVGDLFQTTSDLSTLSKSVEVGFSEAVHKAKIRVDEKGSEAAAATSFIQARMGAVSFLADHPFVYIVYDKVSNIMLFCGVFNSP